MCGVKPECEGIIRYQKTKRVHEARAEHKPDFGNARAHGLFTQAKNQCKTQSGEGLYIVHEVHHEIRMSTHGAEEILHVIMRPPHPLQNLEEVFP